MRTFKISLLFLCFTLLVGCQSSIKLSGKSYTSSSGMDGGITFIDDKTCTFVSSVESSLIVNCTYTLDSNQVTVSFDDVDSNFDEVGTTTQLIFDVKQDELILKKIDPENDYSSTPKWEINQKFDLQK